MVKEVLLSNQLLNDFLLLKQPQRKQFSVFHLLPRNVNYITSWLSMVGPAVGLNLPLSYATAASQEEGNVNGQGKKRSLHSTFPVAEILGLFCIWLCPRC